MKSSKLRPERPVLVTAAVLGLASSVTPQAPAGIVAPYVADANTLHLWHLDEADPGPAQPAPGVTDSFDLVPSSGAVLGAASLAGFGTAGDASAGMPSGLQGVSVPVSGVTGAGGAFTFEAMINTSNITSIQQIASMENGGGRTARPFQFRIDAVDAGGGVPTGNLRFINIASPAGVEQLNAPIPLTGPDAFVANEWFHVAVTYDGNEGAAGNLNLYWTRVDPSRTEATLLASLTMQSDILGDDTVFGVGNEYRLTQDNNMMGLIDEVRVSDIARAADDMLFGAAGPDLSPPELSGTTPPDDDPEVRIDIDLVARFDEFVEAGAGTVTLRRSGDNSVVESFDVATSPQVDFGSGALVIDPTEDLVGGVGYYVLIDGGAVRDAAMNPFSGISDPDPWSFTADGAAPIGVGTTPPPGAGDVSPGTGLTFTFIEEVIVGAGEITVHLAAGGTVVETVDITSGAVTIDGGVVDVTLSAQLAAATSYYINISAGAFSDLSGNEFAGIADDTTWAFTTAAIPEGLLFSHDFGGDTSDLDGTTPDITTAGSAWVASPNFNADGSIDQGAGSATLAFTPFDGLVYTLDTSIAGISGDGDWFGLGFANGQSTGSTTSDRFINANVVGAAWMLMKGDASASMNSAFLGTDAVGTSDGLPWSILTNENPGGDIDMRIVLDTTGGAGNWTATWYARRPTDGTYTEIRPTATMLSEDIDSVGLAMSNDGVFGTIESFRLFTGAEPAEDFAISAIEYSPLADEVILTWPSRPSESFSVFFSTDLVDWSGEIDDSLPAADPGESTSAAFDLAALGIDGLNELFFRVVRN